MRRSMTVLAVVALSAVTFAGTSSASTGRDRAAQASADRSAHQRIVDYWTPQRRAAAIPRVVGPVGEPAAKPANPGGGKGGGGGGGGGDTGGSTTVTGATWSLGGDAAATTGKVFFTLNGTNYQCSGSAADSDHGNLVVSAGHCLHGGGPNGSFATNWVFYPRYDGAADPVLGVWTATQLHTTDVWATTTNGFDDDAGFAVVTDGDGDAGTTLESVLLKETDRRVPTVDFSLPTDGIDYFALGYPAQKKYKGSKLSYCAGPVTERYDGNETLALACDMTGGSSGGPWIRDYDLGGRVLNSVNSYGYASLNGVMFGPIFDDGEKAAFNRADGASCTERCSTVAA